MNNEIQIAALAHTRAKAAFLETPTEEARKAVINASTKLQELQVKQNAAAEAVTQAANKRFSELRRVVERLPEGLAEKAAAAYDAVVELEAELRMAEKAQRDALTEARYLKGVTDTARQLPAYTLGDAHSLRHLISAALWNHCRETSTAAVSTGWLAPQRPTGRDVHEDGAFAAEHERLTKLIDQEKSE